MNYTTDQYDRLLEELYKRHPSVQNTGFNAGSYKPGLAGMQRFDAALGHPSQQFRSVHVAGTNGKGSVCSMLAAALSAAGLRVGLYTSPHLVFFNERIRIAGRPVADELLAESLARVEDAARAVAAEGDGQEEGRPERLRQNGREVR